MSVRLLLTAGLALFLLGGCRYDPHTQLYIDNVNAEKRLLEDTLYDLQYDYECKIQEVDKLRGELTQLKSGETTGSTSRPGTGSSRSSDASSEPDGELFPDIPELKPPTVEPGTREPAKTPDQDGPRKLDDMDDLEPPILDLGDEKRDASAVPKPLEPQAEARQRDPAARPSKLASRWTPRAERRQESPARRINVADSPDQQPADAGAAARVGDPAPSTAGERAVGTGAASTQAQRPQWRPYR